MSDVRVHANSAKPAEVGALAYAQGSDIHLGPGQEKHLPHEAWHVVQQREGRVRPTTSVAGVAVNDDPALEGEADAMDSAPQRGKRRTLAPRTAEPQPPMARQPAVRSTPAPARSAGPPGATVPRGPQERRLAGLQAMADGSPRVLALQRQAGPDAVRQGMWPFDAEDCPGLWSGGGQQAQQAAVPPQADEEPKKPTRKELVRLAERDSKARNKERRRAETERLDNLPALLRARLIAAETKLTTAAAGLPPRSAPTWITDEPTCSRIACGPR